MANNDIGNKACPKKCYWINQGLIYVLIILITMISTISFFKLLTFGAGDAGFVSRVEFGATLSSIILSVVAIVYTLIQSKQSETVNAKIIDASEMVEVHSEILKNSVTEMEKEVNILKDMNLSKTLKEQMDKLDKKLDSIGGVVTGGFNEVSVALSNFDNKLLDGKYTVVTENDNAIAVSFISSIFESTQNVTYAKAYLYILMKVYVNNLKGIIEPQIKDYFNGVSDGVKEIYTDMKINAASLNKVMGMHSMNKFIGLVSSEGKLNIEVKKINEILSDFKERYNSEKFNRLDKFIESTFGKVS